MVQSAHIALGTAAWFVTAVLLVRAARRERTYKLYSVNSAAPGIAVPIVDAVNEAVVDLVEPALPAPAGEQTVDIQPATVVVEPIRAAFDFDFAAAAAELASGAGAVEVVVDVRDRIDIREPVRVDPFGRGFDRATPIAAFIVGAESVEDARQTATIDITYSASDAIDVIQFWSTPAIDLNDDVVPSWTDGAKPRRLLR